MFSGFKVLGYLIIGSLLSMGVHPVAGKLFFSIKLNKFLYLVLLKIKIHCNSVGIEDYRKVFMLLFRNSAVSVCTCNSCGFDFHSEELIMLT